MRLHRLARQVVARAHGDDGAPSTDRLEEAVSLAHHHDAVITFTPLLLAYACPFTGMRATCACAQQNVSCET